MDSQVILNFFSSLMFSKSSMLNLFLLQSKSWKKQILETKIIKFLIARKEETKSMGDLVQSWEGYVQAPVGLHLI